jgi:ubiquinone/menaquinone biosynthesis C-methylase UbiE
MRMLNSRRLQTARPSLIVFTVLVAFQPFFSLAQDKGTYQEEADRLAVLLDWHPTNTVAEIGAGHGQLTLAAAKRVGKIYSTELEGKLLTNLQQLAETEKNIDVVKAEETETNLPPACCDSIFMRLVYHHFTKPAEMDASLFRALKPGGLLAVIDEEPPANSKPPEGVPQNRGGHGMPQKLLVEELTSAGFQVVKSVDDWPNHGYCAVFRRPSP